jgi:hypothetical protein
MKKIIIGGALVLTLAACGDAGTNSSTTDSVTTSGNTDGSMSDSMNRSSNTGQTPMTDSSAIDSNRYYRGDSSRK